MADGSGQNKVLLAQKLHHYMNDLIALLITGQGSTFLGPGSFLRPYYGSEPAEGTAGNLPRTIKELGPAPSLV
jgi:hypothetical protein